MTIPILDFNSSNYDPSKLLKEGFYFYKYIILHNGLGFRCGYVNVPEGHPVYNTDDLYKTIHCHGGITYFDRDTEDNSLWIGFDCMHYGDKIDTTLISNSGSIMKLFQFTEDISTIKTTEYVEKECKDICLQLEELKREFKSSN